MSRQCVSWNWAALLLMFEFVLGLGLGWLRWSGGDDDE